MYCREVSEALPAYPSVKIRLRQVKVLVAEGQVMGKDCLVVHKVSVLNIIWAGIAQSL